MLKTIIFLGMVSWLAVSCKIRQNGSEIQAVGDVDGKQYVWPVNNSWNAGFEEKYQKWLRTNIEVDQDNQTVMQIKYIVPVQKKIRETMGYSKSLDCADTVIFLRARFAKDHQLPFMMKFRDKKGLWWFLGHFGFRTAHDYQKTAVSEMAFSYQQYEGEKRFAAFIWDISKYFNVSNLTSSMSLNQGDLFDIYPEDMQVGDIFVLSEFWKSGHSITIGKVDFQTPPFIEGYSYGKRETFLHIIPSEYNKRKGGGLKRWKWAVRKAATADSSKLIWTNIVPPGARVYQSKFDEEKTDQNTPNRQQRFVDFFSGSLKQQGVHYEKLLQLLIDHFRHKLTAFAHHPASCNMRLRVNKQGQDLLTLFNFSGFSSPAAKQQLLDQAYSLAVVGLLLFDSIFPYPEEAGYHGSAICGWDNSDIFTFFRVMEVNKPYIADYLGTHNDHGSYFKEVSNLPLDTILNHRINSLDALYQTLDISDAYKNIAASDLSVDLATAKVSKLGLIRNPFLVYRFTQANICSFVPPTKSGGNKWQADEGWIVRATELWPPCYFPQ